MGMNETADTPSLFASTRVISWAQNAEDIVLRRAFSGRTTGFYIDIGAADPTRDSVTKFFYDLGWSGINVEPQIEHLADLERERTRDLNLGCAVGATDGTLTLWRPPAVPGRTTSTTELAEMYRAEGMELEALEVPMRTLASICEEHVSGPIDFLKVDVEGAETAVVAGGDWQRFRPAVVLLEVGDPKGAADAQRLLREADYRSVLFDGINQFFVAEEHAAIAPLVSVPANVLDAFDSYIYADQLAAAGAEIERLRRREGDLEGALRTMTSNAGTHAAERQMLVAQRDAAQRANEQLRHDLAHCRAEFAQFVESDALLARLGRRATTAARFRAAALLGRAGRS
jgi:FkbM family methyltransferase